MLRHECVWFGIGTFALIRFVLLLAALNLKKVKYTYKAINLLKGEQVCVCVCVCARHMFAIHALACTSAL